MASERRAPIYELNSIPQIAEPQHIATPTKGKKKGRVGRPPLAGDRNSRISVYLTAETAQRLAKAFLLEQYKLLDNNQKIDKSLFLELIIKSWLQEKGY